MTEQLPYWTPPIVNIISRVEYEIPISGAIGANLQGTILSGIITIPFKITGVRFIFPDNAINNVRAYLLYATDDNTSTTGTPTGTNVFSRYSPTAYFVGHDAIINAYCNIDINDNRTRLKLHINNLNNWATIIQVIVSIRRL